MLCEREEVSAYLSRHVHEQNGGDGSLGLAVSLLRPVQSVGLEDAEQVLLTAEGGNVTSVRTIVAADGTTSVQHFQT